MTRVRREARTAGVLQGVTAMIGPGDLVVDCGTHAGKITAQLAATGADVIAFEPDPVPFERLEQGVAT